MWYYVNKDRATKYHFRRRKIKLWSLCTNNQNPETNFIKILQGEMLKTTLVEEPQTPYLQKVWKDNYKTAYIPRHWTSWHNNKPTMVSKRFVGNDGHYVTYWRNLQMLLSSASIRSCLVTYTKRTRDLTMTNITLSQRSEPKENDF